MKRSELAVGMIVESSNGLPYRVVSLDRWIKGDTWSQSRTVDVTVDGHPVKTDGRRAKGTGGSGVLVVRERTLKNPEPGTAVTGRIVQAQQLFPEGTHAAKQKAAEAEWNAELAADKALVERLVSCGATGSTCS